MRTSVTEEKPRSYLYPFCESAHQFQLHPYELRGRGKSPTLGRMSDAFHWPGFLLAFQHAAQAAGFSRTVLVETEAGPLVAWERPSDGPRIYLSAGIHGDEPAGPLALLELMNQEFFRPAIDWAICPALNPTGLAAGSRDNVQGFDLNRDYLLRNLSEVKAHAGWLESKPTPTLFVSLHEDWETSGFYFYEINLGEDDATRAAAIIEAVRPWFPPECGPEIDGHEPRADGWIYHAAEADVPQGWPEAIFMAKKGCPLSFTFETPSHADLTSRVAAHCAAVRAACRHLTDQVGEC
ncbi:MAG: M14 family metallocarboxypeptidase [Gloeobacteraceae cyanobacterium ES-bin-144]|nr:M14 family metallocarboxypeptidase [Verrucomicrobiales bacterium]